MSRLVVVFRVTTRCNLSCGFCAYDRRRPPPRESASAADALALGELLASHRQRREVLVSFLGGEPLLWPELPEVEAAYLGWKLALAITTNGSALGSAALRARLLERYSELTVSVDALGTAHDALRGWRDGYASLERNVSALAAAKSAREPLLRANVVLMRQTFSGFFALCRELARWGIEEVTFNALGGRDRPEFYPEHALSAEQTATLAHELPSWQSALRAEGLTLKGSAAYTERLSATARRQRLPVYACAPAESFLFVDEHVRIAPCSFTASGDGSYALPLPEAATDLGREFRARAATLRHAACDDCQSTQFFGKYGHA